jgi:hypothetical protein
MWTRTLSPRTPARFVYRALFGVTPPDPVRSYRGTARPDLPTLRLLHVGDCGLRSMDAGHDFRAPLGFPRAAAERLLRAGIGVEFAHYFAVTFDQLPDIATLRRCTHLRDAPDVIVIQLGATYARRLILPDRPAIMRLRVDIARRLGRRTFAGYRVLRPIVRRFGRHATSYRGAALVEHFICELREEWPDADVVVLQPFERAHPYPSQLPIAERTRRDLHAAACATGAAELDFGAVLGTDPALRGANGYNLNARGSELAGDALTDWILRGSSAARRAAEPLPAGVLA